MKKKGFTLIELIAVLVIMAIVVLIVVPLVMSIIRKSKENSLKRSVDGYGRAVELAAHAYQLDNGTKANSFDELKVEYSGGEVSCDTKVVYQNNVYLSKCKVGNTYVMDSKSTDGYYHYGDITKYGDIYAKAVSKAAMFYQKKNNKLPTSINDLELNLDGLDFSCNKSKINSDLTVYLEQCSLNGQLIPNITWGEAKYIIGDLVKYNGIKYYIIENPDDSDTIHLMKVEPIKNDEIKNYIYATELHGKISISDKDKYLKMRYLYHDMCVSGGDMSACSADYSTSSVKQIVDVWVNNYANEGDLVADSTGYKARLITYDELTDNLGYAKETGNTISKSTNGVTPDFVYMTSSYWTMSTFDDSPTKVWIIDNGNMNYRDVPSEYAVRPVINIKLSALNS